MNKNNSDSRFTVSINWKLVTEKYLDAVRRKQQWDTNAELIQRQLLALLLKWIEIGEVDLTEIDLTEIDLTEIDV
jgi:hypothetical protein